jgi:hypothetical protein
VTDTFGGDFTDPEPEVVQEVLVEAVPIEQAVLLDVALIERPRIEDYCRASAEYVRQASRLDASQAKNTQIALSGVLGRVALADLRDALHGGLEGAIAGETTVGGGLREVQADVSEMTGMDGLTLAVELKPVHLAVGRAIWNRFGDIRTFAVNIHLKFPFAVVGGVMSLPTQERMRSGHDDKWKSTTHLVERAVARFVRAGGRETEGGATHLLEGIGVIVFNHEDGSIEPDLPPAGTGLRWPEFIEQLATAYDARFGAI